MNSSLIARGAAARWMIAIAHTCVMLAVALIGGTAQAYGTVAPASEVWCADANCTPPFGTYPSPEAVYAWDAGYAPSTNPSCAWSVTGYQRVSPSLATWQVVSGTNCGVVNASAVLMSSSCPANATKPPSCKPTWCLDGNCSSPFMPFRSPEEAYAWDASYAPGTNPSCSWYLQGYARVSETLATWQVVSGTNCGVVNASVVLVSDGCPSVPPPVASCACNPGTAPNGSAANACVPVSPPDGPPPPPPCAGNPAGPKPIYPMTGTERFAQELDVKIAGQVLSATYDSIRRAPVALVGTELEDEAQGPMGSLWASSLHKRLISGGGVGIRADRGSGRTVIFSSNGNGNFTSTADVNDRLLAITGGYRYLDAASRALEFYSTQGQLVRVDRADGVSLSYTYSTSSTAPAVAPGVGYLLSVTDSFGRAVQFVYDAVGRINRISDSTGLGVVATYDVAGNLKQLAWPDGKVRKFAYENAVFPWALTGIDDEAGVRYATIGYDAQGRAIASQFAGGVGSYGVSYGQPPVMQVSDTYDAGLNLVRRSRIWAAPVSPVVSLANGSTASLGVAMVAGSPSMSSQSQPAGAGCAASSSAQSFDTHGNLASRDDFNGTRTCFANDIARNLETVRVDGLAQTASCSALTPPGASATAAVPAGARKTSTQWHPDWRLETRRVVPGRLTTSVYNGQPDPFDGGAIARCAPTTALLPDGKPIAVLCKRVEQSTTDTDGHLGFSAVLQSGVANRVSTWTYNELGQTLTARGPRTAVDDTTTYTYYADTTSDHTVGDLKATTNAAGNATTYDKYNRAGQLLQSTDPNGNVTVNTYDARQHLLTSSVAGETTTYMYDPVGQLMQVTQADGSWVAYEYDDAHRQKAVKDNLGNRIEYQLDNAGSKTGESVKDPTGSLKRSLSHVMDALGRAQQSTGRSE